MAAIVLVHGAFNELWGPHEIASRWVPALQDGLWHHGVAIDASDVAVCFYGDLFRRAPEAVDHEAFESARAGVAEMISKLGNNGILAGLQQAANDAVFDRTVDMVTTMSTTPDLSDQMFARFSAVCGADTKVVVGHSLGSIVSYRALARDADLKPHTLVTLGCPLGSEMMRARMATMTGLGEGAWPGGVAHWVNVAAVGDKVAQPPRLADVYGDRVEDHLVDNGARAHDPEPYLNAVPTGAAIARALAA